MCAQSLSYVQRIATCWAVVHQAPLSIGYFRQEYQSGWPFPPPGDISNPGIESLVVCTVGRFFTAEPQSKPTPTIPSSNNGLC